jgi:hypothetical protein
MADVMRLAYQLAVTELNPTFAKKKWKEVDETFPTSSSRNFSYNP